MGDWMRSSLLHRLQDGLNARHARLDLDELALDRRQRRGIAGLRRHRVGSELAIGVGMRGIGARHGGGLKKADAENDNDRSEHCTHGDEIDGGGHGFSFHLESVSDLAAVAIAAGVSSKSNLATSK